MFGIYIQLNVKPLGVVALLVQPAADSDWGLKVSAGENTIEVIKVHIFILHSNLSSGSL